MGDAMVTLEGQFPFNLVPGPAAVLGHRPGRTRAARCSASAARCTSASRRTRSCSATGTSSPTGCSRSATARTSRASCSSCRCSTRRIDPGMLVKATAAGLDIGSIVSGLNQPVGPVRAPLLIQKALEIAGEVRSLGNALLSAFEKGDAEQLALLRQGHEVDAAADDAERALPAVAARQGDDQGPAQDAGTARSSATPTTSACSARPRTRRRSRRSRRQTSESSPRTTSRTPTTALVGQYDLRVPLQAYPDPQLAQGPSPSDQAGATGQGQLYLNQQEDAELNTNLPLGQGLRIARQHRRHDRRRSHPHPER